MNIYFSGIGGVGIGPLAEIAHDAGNTVMGSDVQATLVTKELESKNIPVAYNQDGNFLEENHKKLHLDWYVYTSALPDNHPELTKARELGIKTGKRDEFLANFIEEHGLKMIAVAGTHGKTNTTGMAIWAFKELGIPISYSVGTTLSFGPSGLYNSKSEYFIYECDEFDRNFLHFYPEVSLITSVDYDHPDTYKTENDYKQAFLQYLGQSKASFMWKADNEFLGLEDTDGITVLDESTNTPAKDALSLPGEHTRRNAGLVIRLLETLGLCSNQAAIDILNKFPGTDRRFEKLKDGIYSDYGHHPKEIAATLQLAKEVAKDVTLVYQPHQNIRQHEVIDMYTDAIFKDANGVIWLPTYLTREDPELEVLDFTTLTRNIKDKEKILSHKLNDDLADVINTYKAKGSLVLFMGAGTIDNWARNYAKSIA